MSQHAMLNLGIAITFVGGLGFFYSLVRTFFEGHQEQEQSNLDVVVPAPYDNKDHGSRRTSASLMVLSILLIIIGAMTTYIGSAVPVPYGKKALAIRHGKVVKILAESSTYHLVPPPDSIIFLAKHVQISSAVTDTFKTVDGGLVELTYSYVWQLDDGLFDFYLNLHPNGYQSMVQQVVTGPGTVIKQEVVEMFSILPADYEGHVDLYKELMKNVVVMTSVRVGYENPIKVLEFSIYKVTVIKPGSSHPRPQLQHNTSEVALTQELAELMARLDRWQ